MEKLMLYISNPAKNPGLMFSHWLSVSFSASDFPCAILFLLFLPPDFLSNQMYRIISTTNFLLFV